MLVASAVLLGLLTIVPARGRLALLAEVRLRASWLVAAALLAQVLVVSVIPDRLDGVHEPVHLGSYVLLGAFVWMNRAVPGLLLVGLGAAANIAAITANGGVMPASASALAAAGMPADKEGAFANSAQVEEPRLAWLGDVVGVPGPWPLGNVFSVGDVLIVVGVTLGVHVVCRTRLIPRRMLRAA